MGPTGALSDLGIDQPANYSLVIRKINCNLLSVRCDGANCLYYYKLFLILLKLNISIYISWLKSIGS